MVIPYFELLLHITTTLQKIFLLSDC
uniref:Uncharacterized protein n=1 Tax=Arundo donax TaxID=35708 RepID=A0A0A9CDD8_ARUDO